MLRTPGLLQQQQEDPGEQAAAEEAGAGAAEEKKTTKSPGRSSPETATRQTHGCSRPLSSAAQDVRDGPAVRGGHGGHGDAAGEDEHRGEGGRGRVGVEEKVNKKKRKPHFSFLFLSTPLYFFVARFFVNPDKIKNTRAKSPRIYKKNEEAKENKIKKTASAARRGREETRKRKEKSC